MNDAPPTVFVVDDDPSYRRAVARLLRASGFAVAVFASGRELLDAVDRSSAGCVLTDLRMPEIDGLRLQDALRSAGCPLPCVFVSGAADVPSSVRAMRQGAEDFIAKDASRDDLLAGITRAIERSRRERDALARRENARRRIATLSDRERQVLDHVLQGKLNKQIADDLGLHERTVKLHRTAITRKTGLPSVAELVRLAHDAGWFDADPS